MTLSEIMKGIKSLNVPQKFSKIFEKKNQENVELKVSLYRLYTKIQKQC